MSYDAIIVGAGLFGQVIAKGLRDQGRTVCVLDAKMPNAGSAPAACLMKPSWFSSMGRDKYDPALKLLDRLYGVQDIEFRLRPSARTATVHWIPPRNILGLPFVKATVSRVARGRVYCDDEVRRAPLIIVAAGIWTQRLLPQYPQLAQMGASFMLPRATLDQPFIRPWAPYKQLVAFNRGDGLWVGDGSAIKAENWTVDHIRRSRERCMTDLEDKVPLQLRAECKVITGARPYSKDARPCLVEEVEKGLWVASGGAKNGTIAAGWCAHLIREKTS